MSLFVIHTLEEYLRRAQLLRGSNTPNFFLFFTLLAPHSPASSDAISRWLKWTLARAGLDTKVCTANSTRSASTPAAYDRSASINLIRKAAGWMIASTFAKLYNKRTEAKATLGRVVMERYLTKR